MKLVPNSLKDLKDRYGVIATALVSVALVLLSALNLAQRGRYRLPDDGVSWIDSSEGVQAWIVRDGPAGRAGVREGDVLEAIEGKTVRQASDAAKLVFSSGAGSELHYELSRNGRKFRASIVLVPQDNSGGIRRYVELVGILYLCVGAFLLVRRWTTPKVLHFYLFCLASFVLCTFSYTGRFDRLDWAIYWLNVLAVTVQPALFLHFCLTFPARPSFLPGRRFVFPMIYAPGMLLLAAHVLVALGIVVLPVPLAFARWLLDRIELIYLVAFFGAGALALQYTYHRVRVPLLRQQLKWVTRGAFLAIVPFGALYAIPYFLGFLPAAWMKLSVLSLVFLPLTFAYAIVRYRLMDVDTIFQRGAAYTLATATIVVLYWGLIALFANFFRSTIPVNGGVGWADWANWASWGTWVLAILITAFLFQPLANGIQSGIEKLFNPQRYDYRRTLLDLAREVTSELRVEPLLSGIAERLTETLGVDRLGVFLADGSGSFRLAESRGIGDSNARDLSFLDPARPELKRGYLFFDTLTGPYGFSPTAQATLERLGLHYYLPLEVKGTREVTGVKGQTLGYLGLGKTHRQDYLSSQDVDLLRTIAGYLSIALENARLYGSIEDKVHEYQALKDFNENIIESIDGGVVACDLQGRVEFWNHGMERLYGLRRSEALGKKLHEVFPADLMAELSRASEARSSAGLYKFPLLAADGRQRRVSVSAVPLLGKDHRVMGRLLILSDLTERVELEDQLAQAEKLSSIGLLAAGVAHEVNTPLAVIASQSQMLMKQMPLEDSRTRILEKVIKQAFRASEIVNHLLKFSRVSGREFSELDLNKVIRETVSLAEPMLRASKISVNAQLASSLPIILGNQGKLQQVFMNLILNARDAMPHGGELTVVTEFEDSAVTAEFSDTGVGISPENLKKIFDPFFTTKSTSRGTGLGLAVTYGIIHEHAGKIRVESQVGRGTCFRLEFPRTRKEVSVG